MSTLWAMEAGALKTLLDRPALGSGFAGAIAQLFGLASGPAAGSARAADPVRDGALLTIPVQGVLSPKGTYGTSTERLANQVLEAGYDDRIGVVILNMMSPGGMMFGTAEAADAVYETRRRKPVIAVANTFALSACHWIACQVSAYYVTTSGEVGGVGIVATHTDRSGLEAKLGIKTTLVASSDQKIAGHPYAPLSARDRAEMQAQINEGVSAFHRAIARGRGISATAAAVTAVHGHGRSLSARAAAKAGAVDGVKTLREVIAEYSSASGRLALHRRRAEVAALAARI